MPSYRVNLQPIVPKSSELLNPLELDIAIQKAERRVAKNVQKDFKDTVRTWKTKPDFEIEIESSHDELAVTVGTDSDIYKWTTEGTQPHIIRPRNAPMLHFRTNFTPKTVPGVIRAQSGNVAPPWRSAMVVLHPGTKARKFEEAIVKRRQKTLEQEINQEIAKLLRRR